MQSHPDDLTRITRCEVCGGGELSEVLDLGLHPLCDDLVPVGDDRTPAEYPVCIVFCETCKTAHQKYQVKKRTLFPENYHYRARHTADVLKGMRELVDDCQKAYGNLARVDVLDIGCNDGSLLSIFAEKGASTFGIEPTAAAADASEVGHKVYQDYLSPALAEQFVKRHGQPNIITFTNVFAHIEDLPAVLSAIRTLMSPTTLLVVENHYLGSVLDRFQFDTFYHEHPRTYSLTSFIRIAESLNASIVACNFPARYGGNIRVMLRTAATSAKADLTQYLVREDRFGKELAELGQLIPLWQVAKRKELEQLVTQHGPLPGKAFPGRAAILVKLLGLDGSMLSAVYEKPTSMKVGHYLPATNIPIRSDDDFGEYLTKDVPLLNLAWHISAEIHGYMRKSGFKGRIVDILTTDEMSGLG